MRKVLVFLLMGVCLIGFMGRAWSAGTPAGTVIYNWALMNYTDRNGLNSYTAYSDTVMIVIQFDAGVLISPDTLAQNAYPETQVFYSHYVKNIGNGPDQYDLTVNSSHGWTTTIYLDANGDGVVDPGDTSSSPLTTTDTILADDSIWIFAMLEVPETAIWGDEDVMTVVATSLEDGSVNDSAFDFTTIVGPNLSLEKVANPAFPLAVAPYDTISYDLTVTNSDSIFSRPAFNVFITDGRPSGVTFVDSTTYPENWRVRYFATGSWSGTFNPLADSIGFEFLAPSSDSLLPAASANFSFLTEVIDCITESLITDIAFVIYRDGVGPHIYKDTSNTVTTDVVQSGVTLFDSTLSRNGTAGDTVEFPFVLTNTGDSPDSFMVSLVAFPDSWTSYSIYRDIDCDSSLDVIELASEIDHTTLLAAAGSWCLIVQLVVPNTAAGSDSVLLAAVSYTNSCAADTSFLQLNLVTPLLQIFMYVNGVDSVGAAPGDTMTYTIDFTNIGLAEADSIELVDSLDINTYIDTASVNMPLVPSGFSWPGDFAVDWWNGTAWQTGDWPPAIDPPDAVRAIRIRETHPANSLGVGDNGQFKFKVIIK
ncbi:hypothetical protein JW877_07195 [bacterium]|nr:hypothetical protein [bacterium]